MTKENAVKKEIQIKDEFVEDLMDKSPEEIRMLVKLSMGGMIISTYDLLRSSYIVELRGFYKEFGYEDFESWVTKETFLTSYSQFRDYLRVAKRYSRMLVEHIGFQNLAAIERLPLLENTRQTLISKLENDIETTDRKFSRKQILSLARPLALKRQFQSEPGVVDVLRTRLKVARAKISEQAGQIRDLNEKLLKAQIKIEDQGRYIEELQKGERPV